MKITLFFVLLLLLGVYGDSFDLSNTNDDIEAEEFVVSEIITLSNNYGLMSLRKWFFSQLNMFEIDDKFHFSKENYNLNNLANLSDSLNIFKTYLSKLSDKCRNNINFIVNSLNQTAFLYDKYQTFRHSSNISDNENMLKQLSNHSFAFEVIDASAKIRTGPIEWNSIYSGTYDECLNIKANLNTDFKTQYCVLKIDTSQFSYGPKNETKPNCEPDSNEIMLQFQYCFPHECLEDEIINFANGLFKVANSDKAFCQIQCHNPNHSTANFKEFFAILFIAGAIFVIGFATFYDVHYFNGVRKVSGSLTKADKVILAFSIKQNLDTLLSNNKHARPLFPLESLKVIALHWIIYGKIFMMFDAINDEKKPYNNNDAWIDEVIVNPTIAIDLLFIITGIITTWSFLAKVNKRNIKKSNTWIMFFWNKFIRVFPAYGFLVIMYTVSVAYIPSEKYTNNGEHDGEKCVNYWFFNLLFIQNIFGFDKMCLPHTWYLATTFQLFILTPFLLIAMIYSKKIATIIIWCLIGISYAAIGLPFFLLDNSPSKSDNPNIQNLFLPSDYFFYHYTAPWTKLLPYTFGMASVHQLVLLEFIELESRFLRYGGLRYLIFHVMIACTILIQAWAIIWSLMFEVPFIKVNKILIKAIYQKLYLQKVARDFCPDNSNNQNVAIELKNTRQQNKNNCG
uniref:NRF domain-containing protein n=1 Tax=Rhabditophanes sp. KR3021 TaxID=114890 RepID=A0AC35TL45_9BILA